jgi:hypothetical protein
VTESARANNKHTTNLKIIQQVLLNRQQVLLIAVFAEPRMFMLTCNTTYRRYQLEPRGSIAVFELAIRGVFVENRKKW